VSFKIQSISAEAHELEAKVEAAEGRATKIAQVIAKHVEEIAKEIGGYITISGGGHLNSVEGQPGDSVVLNINSLPNPAKPTPSGLYPPEASGANPQPADGSPAARQEAVPQPLVIGMEDGDQPPIVPDRDPATQAQPQLPDSQVEKADREAALAAHPDHPVGWEGAATNPDGTTAENPDLTYSGIGSQLPAESNLPDPSNFPLVTGDASTFSSAPVVLEPAAEPYPTALPVESEPVPPPADAPQTWAPVEPAVDISVPAPPFSDPPAPAQPLAPGDLAQ
jgi:hypothetical protein